MSEVYFISRRANFGNSMIKQLGKLIDKMEFKKSLNKNDTVAIKVHFGEKGITSFLRPIFIKPFTDSIKSCEAHPFITDANTIYRGSRSNGVEHLITAIENGFGYSVTGAPLIIADGVTGEDLEEVDINGKYYKKVKIAGEAHRAKAMIVLSHFKGHEMFGFGGAIKNIGMGLAAKEGKLSIHSTGKPYVKKKGCVQCGVCLNWCPVEAIEMQEESSFIIETKCTGCGQCIMSCPSHTITLKWDMAFSEIQKKTAEYALGTLKPKLRNIWFFNFLIEITPECDCYPYSDASIVPDIGILASQDPVAIDQASYDLVKNESGLNNSKAEGAKTGEDKFKKCHEAVNPSIMLDYAQEIGLGQKKYNLISI